MANHCMQCGYCTPGFVVTAKNLLDKNADPTAEEIREELAGNLCRCGTYPQHPKAIRCGGCKAPCGRGGIGESQGSEKLNSSLRPIMPVNPMEHDKYVPESFSVVGKRGVRRIDGERKASGKAVYTKDVNLPGMIIVRIMTSPYPNARIKSMDTSRAEGLTGVRCVLRYDDPEIFGKMAASTQGVEEEMLSRSAYFEGQQLGVAIAADSEDIANQALRLVKVEWEKRPFVLDPELAALPDAPPARPERLGPSNHLPLFFGAGSLFSFGDVEKGLKEADQVITFNASRKYHGLGDAEPLAGVAKWEGDCLELWVHHQHPYEHKWVAHEWFGIPMNKIKINSPYNGAMFGGWNWVDYSMIPTYISAHHRKENRPACQVGIQQKGRLHLRFHGCHGHKVYGWVQEGRNDHRGKGKNHIREHGHPGSGPFLREYPCSQPGIGDCPRPGE